MFKASRLVPNGRSDGKAPTTSVLVATDPRHVDRRRRLGFTAAPEPVTEDFLVSDPAERPGPWETSAGCTVLTFTPLARVRSFWR